MFKFNFGEVGEDEDAVAQPTFEAQPNDATQRDSDNADETYVNGVDSQDREAAVAAFAKAEIVDEHEIETLQAAICDEDVLLLGDVRLLRPVFSSELFVMGVEERENQKVEERDRSVALAAVVSESRDVLPGIYEGGFKLWECSIDLLHYLHDNSVALRGKRVAEYGCGMAMPGLFALLSGASHVHFQDYNKEVLLYLTVPAVQRNVKAQVEAGGSVTGTVEYMSGDWTCIEEDLVAREQQFDVILTTDTLYSAGGHAKLCSLIKGTLAPGGVAFVAAKSYYFGVGGSVLEFQQLAEKEGFGVEKVKTIDDRQSNVREIIKLCALL